MWLVNKTHYQIDEIIRITIITFYNDEAGVQKEVINRSALSQSTGMCHSLPLPVTEEHSLYTSREYINFIFLYICFFFLLILIFFHIFSFCLYWARDRYGGVSKWFRFHNSVCLIIVIRKLNTTFFTGWIFFSPMKTMRVKKQRERGKKKSIS